MRINSLNCSVPSYGKQNICYAKNSTNVNLNPSFGRMTSILLTYSVLLDELFKDGGKKGVFKIIKASSDIGNCVRRDINDVAAKWKREYVEVLRNEGKVKVS